MEAEQLNREREVIRAMQQRQRRWHGPVGDFLWRRPWRSPAPVPPLGQGLINWLRAAHDCSDPSVGCSCTGGYRFPRLPQERGGSDG
jgi:hypothetical protein